MSDAPIKILFVSRRNTVRSLLAEACLNHLGKGRFLGLSCGAPAFLGEQPHPLALKALVKAMIPTDALRCRSWVEFTRVGAPRTDFVIALDELMLEIAPRWPSQADTALWNYPDVLQGETTEGTAHALLMTLYSLRRRIELLTSLPMRSADRSALRGDVRDLGHMS